MYILHKEESEGRADYILNSESQRVVLSLSTNDDISDDTPDAHVIRFWPLAANLNETRIGYQKSDEKEAIQAFRKILAAAKDSLANLSDFQLTEPRSTKKAHTKASPKGEPQTG